MGGDITKGAYLALIVAAIAVAGAVAGFVIVEQQPHNMEKVEIVSSLTEVIPGETYSFEAVITPNNTTDKTLIWSVSDPDVKFTTSGEKITLTIPSSAEYGKKMTVTVTSKAYSLTDSKELTVVQSTSSQIDDYVHSLKTDFPVIADKDDTEYMDDGDATDNGYTLVSDKTGYRYKYVSHSANNTYSEMINLGAMDSIYYPGAVLSMTYDDNGNKILKSVNIERAPMTISIGLETASGIDSDKIYAEVENPKLSTVRESISKMINGTITSGSSIPCVLSCEIVSMDSDKALSLALGADANIGMFSASAECDYSESSSMTRAVLIFKQIYYTIDMDRPVDAASVFKDTNMSEIKSKIGTGSNLVYCSVVYGKIALVSIETTMSMEELKASFNASYSTYASLSASFEETLKDETTSMSYFIYGGDTTSEIKAIESSTISEAVGAIIKNPTDSPKPIAYRFYNLDDGTLASYSEYTEYTSRENVPVELEVLTINPKDHSANVQAGEAIELRKTISPSDAIIYTSETYTVNCDTKYAYYDSALGKLIITEDANEFVSNSFEVTLTITQLIGGEVSTKTATYTFNIISIPATGLDLSVKSRTIGQTSDNYAYRGETICLEATVSPDDATYDCVNWTYDGDIIVTYSDDNQFRFTVNADAVGTIAVTATQSDGFVRTMTFDVSVPVTSASIARNGISDINGIPRSDAVIIGETASIIATLNANATYAENDLTWTVSANADMVKCGKDLQISPKSDATGYITVYLTVNSVISNTITLEVFSIMDAKKSYGVSFTDNGETIHICSVKEGEHITDVPDMSYYEDGGNAYTFVGWKVSGTVNVIDLSVYTVNGNVTLDAVWSVSPVPQYTVYLKNNDTVVAQQTVYRGDTITMAVPTLATYVYDGYTYTHTGWMNSTTNQSEYPSGHTVTADVTFTAVWSSSDNYAGYTRLYSADTFKSTIENNYGGKYVLMRDITLSETFRPIGDSGSGAYGRFTGEFNGNGKVITYNISYTPHGDNSEAHIGLFAITDTGAHIYGLNVNASIYITKESNINDIGAIVGTMYGGFIENCNVTNAYIRTDNDTDSHKVYCGGVAGCQDGDATISNVTATTDIYVYANSCYCGGIIGVCNGGTMNVTNCTTYGKVVSNGNSYIFIFLRSYRDGFAGGIAGLVTGDGSIVVSNCNVNSSEIWARTGNYRGVGSILGGVWSGSEYTMSDNTAVLNIYYEGSNKNVSSYDPIGYGN